MLGKEEEESRNEWRLIGRREVDFEGDWVKKARVEAGRVGSGIVKRIRDGVVVVWSSLVRFISIN